MSKSAQSRGELVAWGAGWSLVGIINALLIVALWLPVLTRGSRPAAAALGRPRPVRPTGETRRGVDVSKYSGPVPEERWARLREKGWSFAVVGAWGSYGLNPHAVQQLSGARAAGLDTAAYVLLHYNDPQKTGEWQVAQGLEAAGAEARHLRFVALDIENKGGPVKTDVLTCIREAAAALESRGICPVIYASRRDWHQLTGNSREFAHLPLWVARFDGDPTLNTDQGRPWEPFGGWTAQAAKQHTGSTDLHGIHADLNVAHTGLWEE